LLRGAVRADVPADRRQTGGGGWAAFGAWAKLRWRAARTEKSTVFVPTDRLAF